MTSPRKDLEAPSESKNSTAEIKLMFAEMRKAYDETLSPEASAATLAMALEELKGCCDKDIARKATYDYAANANMVRLTTPNSTMTYSPNDRIPIMTAIETFDHSVSSEDKYFGKIRREDLEKFKKEVEQCLQRFKDAPYRSRSVLPATETLPTISSNPRAGLIRMRLAASISKRRAPSTSDEAKAQITVESQSTSSSLSQSSDAEKRIKPTSSENFSNKPFG